MRIEITISLDVDGTDIVPDVKVKKRTTSPKLEAVEQDMPPRLDVAKAKPEPKAQRTKATLPSSRICEGCGQTFEPAVWNQIYHTKDCKNDTYRRQREAEAEDHPKPEVTTIKEKKPVKDKPAIVEAKKKEIKPKPVEHLVPNYPSLVTVSRDSYYQDQLKKKAVKDKSYRKYLSPSELKDIESI